VTAIDPQTVPARGSRARSIITAATAVIMLGAAAAVLIHHRADLGSAISSARRAPAWMLAVAIGLPILNWMFSTWTFWLLTRRVGNVSFAEMAALMGASWLANYLPLKPGLAGRIAYHRAVHGIPVAASSVVIMQALMLGVVATATLIGVTLAVSMVNKIEQDHQRFRSGDERMGSPALTDRSSAARSARTCASSSRAATHRPRRPRYVSIPIHDIDIPTFRYGDNSGGVGMGEGEEGQGVGQGQGTDQGGERRRGPAPPRGRCLARRTRRHPRRGTQAPRIQPRGQHKITTIRDKYTGIRPIGPASLRHFKRTYREALKRQLAMGVYDPDNPVIIPIKNDLRFRSGTRSRSPRATPHRLHDGRLGLHGRRAEGTRPPRSVLDRHLAPPKLRGHREPLHRPRRPRRRGRQEDLLLRPEDGGTRISPPTSAARSSSSSTTTPATGTSTSSTSPTATTPPTPTTACASRSSTSSSCPAATCSATARSPVATAAGSFLNVLHEAFPGGRADELGPKVVTSKVNGREDLLESLRTFFKQGR
jgi:hypothetical protein